jgi:hypothetical protein
MPDTASEDRSHIQTPIIHESLPLEQGRYSYVQDPFGMIDRSTLVLQPGYPQSEFFRIEELPSP